MMGNIKMLKVIQYVTLFITLLIAILFSCGVSDSARLANVWLFSGYFISFFITMVLFGKLFWEYQQISEAQKNFPDGTFARTLKKGSWLAFISVLLTFGGLIAFLLCMILNIHKITAWFSMGAIIMAILVLLVDRNLPGIRSILQKFDFAIFLSLILTSLFSLFFHSIWKLPEFANGFLGGSVAFQLIIANIGFDHEIYKIDKMIELYKKMNAKEVNDVMSKTKVLLVSLAVLIIGSLVLYFAVFQKTPEHPTKITVGIATWPGFASGIVGMEKGFFEGIELDHRILDDAPARHAAFQSGDIDIMISSLDVFAQEAAQGIKGKIFLITDESFGGDGIVAKSEIKTPEQLRGKKIAFALATPSHFLLYKVLEKHNLSPSDIQQVKVDDPGHAGQAFLGGSVDAAVTWEPFLTEVKEKGKGHILLTTHEYPGIIVDVLVASDKLLREPELLRRFIRGWLRSVEYIKKHPDESPKIIAKGLKIKSEDVEGMMAGLRFADQARNEDFFNAKNSSQTKLAKMMLEAANFWKSQGIIEKTIPAEDLISTVSTEYFSGKRK